MADKLDKNDRKKKRSVLKKKLGLGIEDSTGGGVDGGKLSKGAIAYNVSNP